MIAPKSFTFEYRGNSRRTIERALVAFRAVKGRGATVSDLVRECLSEAVARRLDQGVAGAVLERSLGRKTHGLDVAGACARD